MPARGLPARDSPAHALVLHQVALNAHPPRRTELALRLPDDRGRLLLRLGHDARGLLSGADQRQLGPVIDRAHRRGSRRLHTVEAGGASSVVASLCRLAPSLRPRPPPATVPARCKRRSTSMGVGAGQLQAPAVSATLPRSLPTLQRQRVQRRGGAKRVATWRGEGDLCLGRGIHRDLHGVVRGKAGAWERNSGR